MEIVPVYDIYKDLKQIENRYIGSKFKSDKNNILYPQNVLSFTTKKNERKRL